MFSRSFFIASLTTLLLPPTVSGATIDPPEIGGVIAVRDGDTVTISGTIDSAGPCTLTIRGGNGLPVTTIVEGSDFEIKIEIGAETSFVILEVENQFGFDTETVDVNS